MLVCLCIGMALCVHAGKITEKKRWTWWKLIHKYDNFFPHNNSLFFFGGRPRARAHTTPKKKTKPI